MPTLPYKSLKPDMIVASPVRSKSGQLIANKDAVLTEQLIMHMGFYGITEVDVKEDTCEDSFFTSDDDSRKEEETRAERIQKTPEFIKFKENFEKKAVFVENSFNDIINKNMPIQAEDLVNAVVDLFPENVTTITMFDMMHSMKKLSNTTYAHSINVSLISRIIGVWNNIKGHDLDMLTLGGLLHDIGKCRIPTQIIEKPGALTANEYAIVKQHPSFGLDAIHDQNIEEQVRMCVLEHHERFDGSGYPLGLTGNEIEDFASIVSIADVYDAMTSTRSYRDGLCPFEVIATFENQGIDKYNPRYLNLFLRHIADSYLNTNVRLNDGSVGRVVLITPQLTRPIIQMDVHFFINLLEHPDLYIADIL